VEQWLRRKIQKRERMKTCPQCDTGYPDSHTTCPIHGLLLNEIRELRPGMVIHKTYRIVRKLGQGGMGVVYLAQHIQMGEQRALKFLSPELSRDEALTSRFLREVRTLRQVRNRNVVDCGDLEAAEDDSLFFSMEFVDGPDLRAFLNNAHFHTDESIDVLKGWVPQVPRNWGPGIPPTAGALPVPLALSITRQIAEGLGAAHSKGMVHRDIKPENILMARGAGAWLPKIADFGIVATKEFSTAYTRTGGTLLTMAYAAPEQWRGTPAASLDGRTDLYALGGLLYEMLTGQTPFHAENYEGWARQHQTTPPQPPSTLRPDLANWQGLDALTLRLLAKDRNERPNDVAELLGLLDAVQREIPASRPFTIVESHPKHVATPSRSGIMKWAVAAILIVIALGIWAAVRFTQSTAPASTEVTQNAVQPATVSIPTATKPSTPASTVLLPAPSGGSNASGATWTDPATGLMWAKKDNDREVNWHQATDYCRNLHLANYSDWRLPSIDELQGIYDSNSDVGGYHVKGNLRLSNWFQWSSSLGKASGEVWGLYFTDGSRSSDPLGISTNGRVLCVRGSLNQSGSSVVKPAPVVPATIRGGGAEAEALIWTDPATSLMWTKKDNGSDIIWQQAMDYCQNLHLAGHSDWRLPSIDELAAIYNHSIDTPAHWSSGDAVTWHVKGNLNLSGLQWSGSAGTTSGLGWYFDFDGGSRFSGPLGFGYGKHALCVRRSDK
jgi:serine/threonine-protein kinase